MFFINRYCIFLIAGILLLCCSNIRWGNNYWKANISSDAKGYYAYLPAVFIYKDLSFGFAEEIEKKYHDANTFSDLRTYAGNGKAFSKYYMGVALLLLPFFLIAHVLSIFLGYPVDGYSKLYAIMVNIGAIFYATLALYYLKRLLNIYKIGDSLKTLILFGVVFGTNIFYYTIIESAMSHVYSFCLITMFVFYSKRYFINQQKKTIPLLALLLGLIVLIRPVNGLIVFALPFLASDWATLKSSFFKFISFKFNIIWMLALPVLFIFCQLYIYHLQTGLWLIDSYPGEAFNWTKPEMIKILFSYKKGLFVYTPLIFISMFGLLPLFRESRYQFFSFLLFFILLTYVLSSWWSWYYGGSFGLRAYIDYYALFMILLAILLNKINLSARRVMVTAVIAITLLCQIQTFQYRYMQIHWSEMNKEKYWDVFLRIDKLVK